MNPKPPTAETPMYASTNAEWFGVNVAWSQKPRRNRLGRGTPKGKDQQQKQPQTKSRYRRTQCKAEDLAVAVPHLRSILDGRWRGVIETKEEIGVQAKKSTALQRIPTYPEDEAAELVKLRWLMLCLTVRTLHYEICIIQSIKTWFCGLEEN